MDFREGYKKSAEELVSPSEEQLQRMTAAVMDRINSAEQPEPARGKRAIPFRKIAYIGGTIAACAAVTIAAVNIIPTLGRVPASNTYLDTRDTAGSAACNSASLADEATQAQKGESEYTPDSYYDMGGALDEAADAGNALPNDVGGIDGIEPPEYGELAPNFSFSTAHSTYPNKSDLPENFIDAADALPTEEPQASNDESQTSTEEAANVLDDGKRNPETGADPEVVAAWETAVESSLFVCMEDFYTDFTHELNKINLETENLADDTLIFCGKTYKLQYTDGETPQLTFTMTDEEIASLGYEICSSGDFSEYQPMYKVFFADNKCYPVYLLGQDFSPLGEYVLVP